MFSYLIIVSLDKYYGSCNIFDDPSDRICVPIITEVVNLNVLICNDNK